MTEKYLLMVVKSALVGFILPWMATAAFAQGLGAVVESEPVVRGGSSVNQQAPANNDALALLLEQNRQLQAEVQALRGMVEEQGFTLLTASRGSDQRALIPKSVSITIWNILLFQIVIYRDILLKINIEVDI